MPKVSVIIPTYNNAKYIDKSINSVLSQTYKDFEIIIVDDGSSDNTKEVLKQYNGKIKYYYQENKGVSFARNKGIRESSGEYIAFLDSDDVWFPNKIEIQILILEKDEKVGLVCSLVTTIDNGGKPLGIIKPSKLPGESFGEFFFLGSSYPSTYLIRKRCFDEVGLFDEKIAILEDLDICLRIALKFKIKIESEPLVYYRIHSQNSWKNEIKVYLNSIGFSNKWLSYFSRKINHPQKVRIQQYLVCLIEKNLMLLIKYSIKKSEYLELLKWVFLLVYYQFKYLSIKISKFLIFFVKK